MLLGAYYSCCVQDLFTLGQGTIFQPGCGIQCPMFVPIPNSCFIFERAIKQPTIALSVKSDKIRGSKQCFVASVVHLDQHRNTIRYIFWKSKRDQYKKEDQGYFLNFVSNFNKTLISCKSDYVEEPFFKFHFDPHNKVQTPYLSSIQKLLLINIKYLLLSLLLMCRSQNLSKLGNTRDHCMGAGERRD